MMYEGKGGQRQLFYSESVLYEMRMNAGSYLSLIELGSRAESQFSHRVYIYGHCSNDLLQNTLAFAEANV
jgi:hypothetical protein